jgi:hypothetical protein
MIDPANAHQAEFTELLTDELHRSPHR